MQLHQSHSVKIMGGSTDIKDCPPYKLICARYGHTAEKVFLWGTQKRTKNFKLTLTSDHDT